MTKGAKIGLIAFTGISLSIIVPPTIIAAVDKSNSKPTPIPPQPIQEVKVIFDLDGGSIIGMKSGNTMSFPKGYKVGQLPTPTKSGFVFDCWTQNDEVVDEHIEIKDNMRLKATYTLIPVPEEKIDIWMVGIFKVMIAIILHSLILKENLYRNYLNQINTGLNLNVDYMMVMK